MGGLRVHVATLTAALSIAGGINSAASPSHGRAWALDHLGPAGLAKCRAFRRVRQETAGLQKAGEGTITRGERLRLEQRLARARAMPPASVTPVKCGVPL